MNTTEPSVDFVYPDEEDTGPDNDYREASRHFLRLLNLQCDFVLSSSSQTVATWAVAYAVGLAVCEGVSISDRAAKLGISAQALSKQIEEFRLSAGLPKSTYCYKQK